MNEQLIQLTREGPIAVVTLNRPRRKNAFNQEMLEELFNISELLDKDLPRAIVVTGAGDAFSAGFDISAENSHSEDLLVAGRQNDPRSAAAVIDELRKAVDRFVELPVPIIAAVNGAAYGGGAELAARCDLRVIDQEASICFSEVKLGLMTDFGGGPALTSLIGPSRAADLILTARRVDSREALDLGLVNRLTPPGGALLVAIGLAASIAGNGPRAVRSALRVIRESSDLPAREALDLEKELAVSLISTGEFLHGVSAFFAKAKPTFPDID